MKNIPMTMFRMACNMKNLYAEDVAVRYYDEEIKQCPSIN